VVQVAENDCNTKELKKAEEKEINTGTPKKEEIKKSKSMS